MTSGGAVRRAWRVWKRIAERIARLQASLLLTVFYVVIVSPFAVCAKCFSDPLRLRSAKPIGWTPRAGVAPSSLEEARRQF